MKVNILLVDSQGQAILETEEEEGDGRFGAFFIANAFPGLGSPDFLKAFALDGTFGEWQNALGLYLFCNSISLGNQEVYLMIGPALVEENWSDEKYLQVSEQLGLPSDSVLEEIASVSRISKPAARMVMNLLARVIKDFWDLEAEKQRMCRLENVNPAPFSPRIANVVQDIYASIQEDDLLIAILDEAIGVSKSDGGSIMLLDEKKGELTIRVSRGLETKKNILQSRVRLGEGIAGRAAQTKSPFLIGPEDTHGFELRRPDIQASLIVPLLVDDHVVGVLNLYTKQDEGVELEQAAVDIQKLSSFVAAAIRSL